MTSGKLLKRDDGRPYGFIISGLKFTRLCRDIAGVPGVTFTDKRRFFWSSDSLQAAFSFKGHDFRIEPDPWDDALWVVPKDSEATYSEIQDVFHLLASSTASFQVTS